MVKLSNGEKREKSNFTQSRLQGFNFLLKYNNINDVNKGKLKNRCVSCNGSKKF